MLTKYEIKLGWSREDKNFSERSVNKDQIRIGKEHRESEWKQKIKCVRWKRKKTTKMTGEL